MYSNKIKCNQSEKKRKNIIPQGVKDPWLTFIPSLKEKQQLPSVNKNKNYLALKRRRGGEFDQDMTRSPPKRENCITSEPNLIATMEILKILRLLNMKILCQIY